MNVRDKVIIKGLIDIKKYVKSGVDTHSKYVGKIGIVDDVVGYSNNNIIYKIQFDDGIKLNFFENDILRIH